MRNVLRLLLLDSMSQSTTHVMIPLILDCHAKSQCDVQAGEGEDGRLKSAIGIGSLLMDGLGDTIRVSLTEDPEYELEPCRYAAVLFAE